MSRSTEWLQASKWLFFSLMVIITWLYGCNGYDLKFVKVSKSNALNESFALYYDGFPVFSSPKFQSNRKVVYEVVIPDVPKYQYTLHLSSANGKYWKAGSYVTFYGSYDNIVLKTAYTKADRQMASISFNNPILESSEWKYSNLYDERWRSRDFDDHSWQTLLIGSSPRMDNQVQYYRKEVVWTRLTVAYELMLMYRYGIVVYIDSTEIIRDNLPYETIGPVTYATGSYTTHVKKHFIRNTADFPNSTFHLNIELHFLKVDMETNKTNLFNAWMAEYHGNPYNGCYSLPFIPEKEWSVMDYDITTFFNASDQTHALAFMVPNYAFSSNAVSIYAYSIKYPIPNSLHLLCKILFSNNSSIYPETMFSYEQVLYSSNAYNTFVSSSNYMCSIAQVTLRNTFDEIIIPELHLEICPPIPGSSFEYPETEPLMRSIDTIMLYPIDDRYSHCEILSGMPPGVSLNTDNCVIYGIPKGIGVYAVSIIAHSPVYATTIVTLSVFECTANILAVERTYGHKYSSTEWFRIKNPTNNITIMEVLPHTVQQKDATVLKYFCWSQPTLLVEYGCEGFSRWFKGSTVSLYYYFSSRNRIMLMKTRFDLFLNSYWQTLLSTDFIASTNSLWKYKNGGIPSEWWKPYIDESEWQKGKSGLFGNSTDQFQFYRYHFYIEDSSIYRGIYVYLQYYYGCIIFVNGNLIFHYHIQDIHLNPESYSEGRYTDLQYRLIAMEKDCLKSGATNTIAIAIISSLPVDKQSYFSCMIVLPFIPSFNSIYSITSTHDGIEVPELTDGCGITAMSAKPGVTDYTIEFNSINDEKYRFNQVTLYAAQNAIGPYNLTVLYECPEYAESLQKWEYSGVYWSALGEKKLFHFNSTCATSSYSIHFESTLPWSLVDIQFDWIPADCTSKLEYPSATVYYKLSKVYMIPVPIRENPFSSFVMAGLPKSLMVDSSSGSITGYPYHSGTYLISIMGRRNDGEMQTCYTSLHVKMCNEAMLFWTLHLFFYMDSEKTLVLIRDKERDLVVFNATLTPEVNREWRQDLCLHKSTYSVYLASNHAWTDDSQFWITAGKDEIVLFATSLYKGSLSNSYVLDVTPIVSMEYSLWKWSDQQVGADWCLPDYDDASWKSVLPIDSHLISPTVTYYRKMFPIPDYSYTIVLLSKIRYIGGVQVFIDGTLVAMYNLDMPVTSTTHANTCYYLTKTSSFSVNLIALGIRPGIHVIGVEYHRCERVIHHEIAMMGLSLYCKHAPIQLLYDDITINNSLSYYSDPLFVVPSEGSYYSHAVIMADIPSYTIEWEIENSIAMFVNAIYVRTDAVNAIVAEFSVSMDRKQWEHIASPNLAFSRDGGVYANLPQLLLSYRFYRLEIATAGEQRLISIKDFRFVYKANSDPNVDPICESISPYSATPSNGIAAVACPMGYRGYLYRKCNNGTFSGVITDKCVQREILSFRYDSVPHPMYKGITNILLHPLFINIVDYFYVEPKLPLGLELDPILGIIGGTPREVVNHTYTIRAANEVSIAETVILLDVEKGYCSESGIWKKAFVNERSVNLCENSGRVMGIRYRECEAGLNQGEWGPVMDYCYHRFVVIGIVIGVCAISSYLLYGLIAFIQLIGKKERIRQSLNTSMFYLCLFISVL